MTNQKNDREVDVKSNDLVSELDAIYYSGKQNIRQRQVKAIEDFITFHLSKQSTELEAAKKAYNALFEQTKGWLNETIELKALLNKQNAEMVRLNGEIKKLKDALSEVENFMERWHHARDNDGETLVSISSILKDAGYLVWFNGG